MRHLACVLAQVERTPGGGRNAVIRDISVTGALLLTRAALAVGEQVRLSLFVTGDPSKPVVATAKVLRAGPRAREVADVWPRLAAVQFDQPLAHLEETIAAIARQQAQVFGDD